MDKESSVVKQLNKMSSYLTFNFYFNEDLKLLKYDNKQ